MVRSGKNYILRGDDSRETGLAVIAAEELFKSIELSKRYKLSGAETKTFKIHCSIYFVHHGLRVDLIQKSTTPYEVVDIYWNEAEFNTINK